MSFSHRYNCDSHAGAGSPGASSPDLDSLPPLESQPPSPPSQDGYSDDWDPPDADEEEAWALADDEHHAQLPEDFWADVPYDARYFGARDLLAAAATDPADLRDDDSVVGGTGTVVPGAPSSPPWAPDEDDAEVAVKQEDGDETEADQRRATRVRSGKVVAVTRERFPHMFATYERIQALPNSRLSPFRPVRIKQETPGIAMRDIPKYDAPTASTLQPVSHPMISSKAKRKAPKRTTPVQTRSRAAHDSGDAFDYLDNIRSGDMTAEVILRYEQLAGLVPTQPSRPSGPSTHVGGIDMRPKDNMQEALLRDVQMSGALPPPPSLPAGPPANPFMLAADSSRRGQLPPGWEIRFARYGNRFETYFAHHLTRTTTWAGPRLPPAPLTTQPHNTLPPSSSQTAGRTRRPPAIADYAVIGAIMGMIQPRVANSLTHNHPSPPYFQPRPQSSPPIQSIEHDDAAHSDTSPTGLGHHRRGVVIQIGSPPSLFKALHICPTPAIAMPQSSSAPASFSTSGRQYTSIKHWEDTVVDATESYHPVYNPKYGEVYDGDERELRWGMAQGRAELTRIYNEGRISRDEWRECANIVDGDGAGWFYEEIRARLPRRDGGEGGRGRGDWRREWRPIRMAFGEWNAAFMEDPFGALKNIDEDRREERRRELMDEGVWVDSPTPTPARRDRSDGEEMWGPVEMHISARDVQFGVARLPSGLEGMAVVPNAIYQTERVDGDELRGRLDRKRTGRSAVASINARRAAVARIAERGAAIAHVIPNFVAVVGPPPGFAPVALAAPLANIAANVAVAGVAAANAVASTAASAAAVPASQPVHGYNLRSRGNRMRPS